MPPIRKGYFPSILRGNLKYTADHCESPIPAVPPYFVRTHHIHGTRTTDDTTTQEPICDQAIHTFGRGRQLGESGPGGAEAGKHQLLIERLIEKQPFREGVPDGRIWPGRRRGRKTSTFDRKINRETAVSGGGARWENLAREAPRPEIIDL